MCTGVVVSQGKIAMKRTLGPLGKGILMHRHFWRCVFLAALCVPALALMLFASPISVLAATLTPSQNSFAVSPTQGPVGAVISISGTGVLFPDGTQVSLGYTVDYRTCNIVAGGQSGVVQDSAFKGWFRWPAGTGTGTFGICASTNNSFTFQLGSYQVLSASAPRVSVASTTLTVGHQSTVSGANFLPGGTSVSLIWRSTNGGKSQLIGTAVSNGAGAFTHVFTVPVHASTGSYTLTGVVGGGSPPTLSAATTFHVEGVTLVAVPTPTALPSPTSAPTSVAATPAAIIHPTSSVVQPTNATGGETSLLVPIALGGGLLIALALGAGVLVVRKQRTLVTTPDPTSGPLLWPEAANTMVGGMHAGAGAFTPWPGTTYPGGNSLASNPGMEYLPLPGATMPTPTWSKAAPIPFDPGLAEAMHEAQVSLFATPRPPVGEEVEVQ
jgi:hypothetical protein